MNVRTRYAPSPTGFAHIGFVSRILINYALAKQNNGQFIWRNEDTDRGRFVEGALEYNMKWVREYGLDWDEGPDKGGPYGPYNQSERMELYKEAAEKLISNGSAYRCFCTKERLQEVRDMQTLAKQRTKYDGKCRHLSQEEIDENIKNNLPYTVRIKVPENRTIEFDDIITHNHVVWKSEDVDDYIILKSDGMPTYHLAVVVDDMAMKISHVFRGVEWLATTPVHILVYEGLGIKKEDVPAIGHFTVILDPATPGKKFSKRNKSFKANSLLIQGYLREAVLNYLMLLGWAPKDNRELFTLDEYVETFDLKGMQKSNPTWDQKKIDWFNGVYLRDLSLEKFEARFMEWLERYLLTSTEEERELVLVSEKLDIERMKLLINFADELKQISDIAIKEKLKLVQERAINFWDVLNQIYFFYHFDPKIDWDIKQLKKIRAQIREIIGELKELMSSFDSDSSKWDHVVWEDGVRAIADKFAAKAGDVFMALRMSIVSSPFSPPLFESLQILGKDEVVSRIAKSIESID